MSTNTTGRTYMLIGMLSGIGSYQEENIGYDLLIPGCLFRVRIDTPIRADAVYLLPIKAHQLIGKMVYITGEHDGTTLYVTSIEEEATQ